MNKRDYRYINRENGLLVESLNSYFRDGEPLGTIAGVFERSVNDVVNFFIKYSGLHPDRWERKRALAYARALEENRIYDKP